jgi:ABC-type nitrate/sulfonate/bicarbonate transport system ATPase subunit
MSDMVASPVLVSELTPHAGGAVPGVELSGVGKKYGSGERVTEALRGVDLTLREGEFVCLIGASGCGKSTLLRIVAGFESATSGAVKVRGKSVERPGPDRGVVFQDYGLFPWLTVEGNVAYGPRQRGVPKEGVRKLVDRFVSTVGLDRFRDRYPHQLSGGMQQRVAIARVLANDPAVMLMDEPFGALDSLTRQNLQEELIRVWHELRPTVILVTHSVEEAVYLSDRVVVMGGGPSHGVPGHITKVLPVGLSHPRDVTSPAFNDLKRELLQAIHHPADAH